MRRLQGERFRQVLREGSSVTAGWLSLKQLLKEASPSRFGWIVRRKAFASAVKRNRVKRWIRESFYRHREKFHTQADLLAVVARAPAEISYSLVEKTLLSLAKELGSFKGRSWRSTSIGK